jgi:hypothetical protein
VTAASVNDKYRIWGATSQSTYCVLGFLERFSDDYKLMKGDSVAKEWPDDVRFTMDPDFKKQIKLADNLTNPNRVLVASKPLADFFTAKKVPNLEFLPVTIFNHKKKVASNEYCIVNLVTTQDCIDTKKSEVTWNDIDPHYISKMKQIVFDEKKIDKKAALFRAEHLKTLMFIRADLDEEVTAGGFTNVRFWRLSDYR